MHVSLFFFISRLFLFAILDGFFAESIFLVAVEWVLLFFLIVVVYSRIFPNAVIVEAFYDEIFFCFLFYIFSSRFCSTIFNFSTVYSDLVISKNYAVFSYSLYSCFSTYRTVHFFLVFFDRGKYEHTETR